MQRWLVCGFATYRDRQSTVAVTYYG